MSWLMRMIQVMGTGNGEALEVIFALREVSLRGFMVGFFHRYDLIFCSPNHPIFSLSATHGSLFLHAQPTHRHFDSSPAAIYVHWLLPV